MKNIRVAGFALFLLSIAAFAGGSGESGIYDYNDADTIVCDTLAVADDYIVFNDSLSAPLDDYMICDTVSEVVSIVGVVIDEPERFLQLGESSEAMSGGKQFKVYDQSGAEFEYRVNEDGVSVTLLKGDAHGAETLVIPTSVEDLGSYFFVTKIESFAFQTFGIYNDGPMAGVRHLVISGGITTIGQNCFENAHDLETVSVSESLTNLSYSMFYGCENLKKVRIPEKSNLTEIESFAFADCKSLESFYIPYSVKHIGEGPWRGCRSLEKISLSDENYEFVEQDGVLYSDWQGNLIQYPAGKRDKEYTPLFGTKAIDNSAFYGNPYIEKVNFPAPLDSISHIAFYDCTSLREVVFNGKITFIGNMAFADCPELRGVTLYGNPHYTVGEDEYDTFGDNTKVSIAKEVPPVKLEKSESGLLSSAWNYVSQMPYFNNDKINDNKDFGFPDYFGKGKAAVCGNAGPKQDVLRVLESIPSSYLVLEHIDDRDRMTRLYLDKSKKENPIILYFFGGTGGNDLVLALFEHGDLTKVDKMIEEENAKKEED